MNNDGEDAVREWYLARNPIGQLVATEGRLPAPYINVIERSAYERVVAEYTKLRVAYDCDKNRSSRLIEFTQRIINLVSPGGWYDDDDQRETAKQWADELKSIVEPSTD